MAAGSLRRPVQFRLFFSGRELSSTDVNSCESPRPMASARIDFSVSAIYK
jgi:hypothetical protein